ncbi:MAG: alpha-galactosidase [Victivallales bacterium]|nr:alpha-galactosidase [Victivallales bacterium]
MKHLELDERGILLRIGDYLPDPAAQLPFTLHAEGIEAFDKPQRADADGNSTLIWTDLSGRLEIARTMELDGETGILAIRDTLRNRGRKPIVVRKFTTRFDFMPGDYAVYSQQSSWGAESSQGEWRELRSGSLTLHSREGRACEGTTPFAVLRNRHSRHALAFLPFADGDWQLRFTCQSAEGRLPRLAVEAGLADERLELKLAPQERWTAPEVLLQLLPGREAHCGSHLMNRYLNRRFHVREGHAPVVYNTWLDRMGELDVPRLKRQLSAAKECGCEVFVVDYGWYEDRGAFARLDDWTEARDRAFAGKMRQFATQVRKAGLGFGFWVEMEVFHDSSVAVRRHPEWFFASAHPHLVCPKTWLPEVEDYLVESLAAAIRRYGAVYVKNDMNHSHGIEPSRLSRYCSGLYRVMERLREQCPLVTFENCSSGSARMAVGGMLASFDNHFISDNANPLENLRMFQGMVLRFPPGRIYHWYVGAELPKTAAGGEIASWPEGMVVHPRAATWGYLQTEDLDFAMICNLTGQIGFSCDLDSFSPEHRRRLAEYTAFYKKHRDSFLRTEARLLSPPEPFAQNRGWLAFQLSDPAEDRHFLYVFHCLRDGDTKIYVHPEGLDSTKKYHVTECFPDKRTIATATGETLQQDGFACEFPFAHIEYWRGKLLMISS